MGHHQERAPSQAPIADQPEPVWGRIRSFHRMMIGLLRELEVTTDPVRIRDLVGILDRDLPGHFADEVEPGGLFDDLVSRRPASDAILKILRNEHDEILEMVRALHGRLGGADPDHAGILAGKRALLEKLRSHERSENHLVIDTYRVDEGGLG